MGHGITILKDTLRITSEMVLRMSFKGSSDPNDFIFEINVGKKRIRYTATLKLNDEFLDRLKID